MKRTRKFRTWRIHNAVYNYTIHLRHGGTLGGANQWARRLLGGGEFSDGDSFARKAIAYEWRTRRMQRLVDRGVFTVERRVEPAAEVEKRFGLPPGTLQNASDLRELK